MKTFTRPRLPVAGAGFDSRHSFCCVSPASCSLFLSLPLLSPPAFSPSLLCESIFYYHLTIIPSFKPPNYYQALPSYHFSNLQSAIKPISALRTEYLHLKAIRVSSKNLNHLFFDLLNRSPQSTSSEATTCFVSLDNIAKHKNIVLSNSFPSTTPKHHDFSR
jgi:hypothetical protein